MYLQIEWFIYFSNLSVGVISVCTSGKPVTLCHVLVRGDLCSNWIILMSCHLLFTTCIFSANIRQLAIIYFIFLEDVYYLQTEESKQLAIFLSVLVHSISTICSQSAITCIMYSSDTAYLQTDPCTYLFNFH